MFEGFIPINRSAHKSR